MPTYRNPDLDVNDRASALIKKYHPDLHTYNVDIQILMAYALEDSEGMKKFPVLAVNGYACNGITKILGNLDRFQSGCAARIVLDGEIWLTLSPEQQDALLDHEISHLLVARNEKGDIKRDDQIDQPRLKLRKHDRQYGWFDSVANRHGAASAEVEQATRLFTGSTHDVYFSFINELPLAQPKIEDAPAAPKAKKLRK